MLNKTVFGRKYSQGISRPTLDTTASTFFNYPIVSALLSNWVLIRGGVYLVAILQLYILKKIFLTVELHCYNTCVNKLKKNVLKQALVFHVPSDYSEWKQTIAVGKRIVTLNVRRYMDTLTIENRTIQKESVQNNLCHCSRGEGLGLYRSPASSIRMSILHFSIHYRRGRWNQPQPFIWQRGMCAINRSCFSIVKTTATWSRIKPGINVFIKAAIFRVRFFLFYFTRIP